MMRHHCRIVLAVLVTGAVVSVGSPVAAHDAAALDRQAGRVDAAAPGQGQAQVAGRTADQLNAEWAPNAPAYSAQSVASQGGPDKFGGWGRVLIGNLIAVNLAKSMLAAPNNTLTPKQALALATQQVLDARQGEDKRGWGRIAQDLTGQKLGGLLKSAEKATVEVTSRSSSRSPSSARSAGTAGRSSGKAVGRADQTVGRTFDAQASHPSGVVVSGPGAGAGLGQGHNKDMGGREVAGSGGAPGGGAGRGGESDHGGGGGKGGDGPGGGGGGKGGDGPGGGDGGGGKGK
jgi:hypothetical protein